MKFSVVSILQICVLGLLLLQQTTAFYQKSGKVSCGKHQRAIQVPSKMSQWRITKLFIQPVTEGETTPLVADPNSKPQGYMSSDLSSNEDGKQGRVFGYILFALVPVLFLVPFFLSRGFEPPVDPDMAPSTVISTFSKVAK